MPSLETPRLSFRELTPDDYDAVASVLMDDEVMQKMNPLISAELVRRWLSRRLEQYRLLGHSHWHVSLKSTGEFVGIIGIVPEKVEDVEYIGLGYLILREHQRKGYAFEGARACLNWAFRNLHLEKIIAEVAEDNLPSRRLAEKLGMTCEKSYLHFNGERDIPHLLYSSFCLLSDAESY